MSHNKLSTEVPIRTIQAMIVRKEEALNLLKMELQTLYGLLPRPAVHKNTLAEPMRLRLSASPTIRRKP